MSLLLDSLLIAGDWSPSTCCRLSGLSALPCIAALPDFDSFFGVLPLSENPARKEFDLGGFSCPTVDTDIKLSLLFL
jgi:hypothetical protein